ncbi:serine hydrolase domain-containing protein [Flavihumibacter stibioxidans]|uniref:Serine hydrolase n=1 Tax=Flavihumibacter stibioxidans TaxID=1834163 RepID=A0ABR7MD92_9BACT|nr:serine hydrolase [Flavihumibacter stibioxidans]MBC6492993.1 serine hydrolase [Flavihumibacter stibioxidans]
MVKTFYSRLLLVTGSFFLGVLSIAQQPYYPDKTWNTKQASELKMSRIWLDSAVQLALNNEIKLDRDLRVAILKSYQQEPDYKILGATRHRGGPAGLVIKNGYIVAQWGDVERPDMTFSVTKSYLSTIAGLALDNGLIGQVTDKVNRYVWDGSFEGPHNNKITWEHLLTQSSDWSGELFDQYDWADRPPKTGTIDDWRNRKLVEPGTVFEYNDIRVNLLAYSLLQVWRKPLPVVLKEMIQDPIGASSTWRWYGYDDSFVNVDGTMVQSVSGGGHFGGGMFISALDQARYGLLFLRKGKWKDRQLISEKWVNSVHQPSAASKEYGYLWWNNQMNSLKGAPAGLYYAVGYGGNYIIIDQEHDLVVVTRWMDTGKIGDLMQLVIKAAENK